MARIKPLKAESIRGNNDNILWKDIYSTLPFHGPHFHVAKKKTVWQVHCSLVELAEYLHTNIHISLVTKARKSFLSFEVYSKTTWIAYLVLMCSERFITNTETSRFVINAALH